MAFEDTKLMDTPDIRKAYARTEEAVDRKSTAAIVQSARQQLDQQIYQVKAQDMPDEQRTQLLKRIEDQKAKLVDPSTKEFKEFKDQHPKMNFWITGEALSKIGHADAEKMVIAALLRESAETPMDLMDIKKDFGDEVGDMVAEYSSMARSIDQRASKLAKCSDAVKAMVLVFDGIQYQTITHNIQKMAPGNARHINVTHAINMVRKYNVSAFGASSAADEFYQKSFNAYNEAVESGLVLNIEDGKPTLDVENVKEDSYIFAKDFPGGNGPKGPNDGNGNGPQSPKGPKKPGGGKSHSFC